MRKKRNMIIFIGVVAVFIATVLCYLSWNAKQVAGFVIYAEKDVLAVGEEYQLEFECYLNNGEIATPERLEKIEYTWMSSHASVSIDQETGIATGVSVGDSNISVGTQNEWSRPILIFVTENQNSDSMSCNDKFQNQGEVSYQIWNGELQDYELVSDMQSGSLEIFYNLEINAEMIPYEYDENGVPKLAIAPGSLNGNVCLYFEEIDMTVFVSQNTIYVPEEAKNGITTGMYEIVSDFDFDEFKTLFE